MTSGKLTAGGLRVLTDKLEKLNKRAVRLGVEGFTLRVVGETTIRQTSPAGVDYDERAYDVEITGSTPRINGWGVVARIEFTEAGNLVHCAPEAGSVASEWRTVGNECQHCNSKRNRKDLIVIRDEAGSEKIVGRNCLADYIRTDNAEGLLHYADCVGCIETIVSDSEKEYWGGGGYAESEETLDTILKFASLCIRKLGWVSGSAARNDLTGALVSTASNVAELLYGGRRGGDAYKDWMKWIEKNDLHANEHDDEEARLAKEWVYTLSAENTANSEYLHNLRVIRDLPMVPQSKFGYAVSIICAARKARDEAIEYAKKTEARGERTFIGSEGERLKGLTVTVKRVRSSEGNFGVTTIITFESGSSDLTWFASGDKTEDYAEGDSMVVDATVKKHKTDTKYGNSTIVTRVTLKKSLERVGAAD